MSPPMTKESVHWTALGDIIHLDCEVNYTKAYTTVTGNTHLTLIDNNHLRIDIVLGLVRSHGDLAFGLQSDKPECIN